MTLARAIIAPIAVVAATAAPAADLPVSKAAPVEYVRVCTTHGEGFFYIPGTDTCIRIGGRARFEYQYTSRGRQLNGGLRGDVSGYRGLGRISVDARTATPYGTLRTFVRFEIASRTGGYSLFSGTDLRYARAFPAAGIDTFQRAQTAVIAEKAFVQFAGLTAGRFNSFFDFYGHDIEFIAHSPASDVQSTNGIAYTAMFGAGVAATLSIEDPTFRRYPLYTRTSGSPPVVALFTTPVGLFDPATGLLVGRADLDISQREQIPDVVGAVRADQSWGSAQLSGALHPISVGNFTAATVAGIAGRRPDTELGFAVQGGVKINLPMLAAGDALFVQGAYGQGALGYTGAVTMLGGENLTGANFGRFAVNTVEGYVDIFGRTRLSESFSAVAALLHYWTPQVRSALFGGYSGVNFGAGARSATGPEFIGVGGTLVPVGAFTPQQLVNFQASSILKDYDILYVGANLLWSPVKQLDIGVEVSYGRVTPASRVRDQGRVINTTVGTLIIPRTVAFDHVLQTRVRVQRDF